MLNFTRRKCKRIPKKITENPKLKIKICQIGIKNRYIMYSTTYFKKRAENQDRFFLAVNLPDQ